MKNQHENQRNHIRPVKPGFRDSGTQGLRDSGIQGLRDSGTQGLRDSAGIQGFRPKEEGKLYQPISFCRIDFRGTPYQSVSIRKISSRKPLIPPNGPNSNTDSYG